METVTVYSHLERATNEIRIFYLNPGQQTEEISGTLRTFPINLAPSYEALSYAWGNPKKTGTILLDQHPFGVTENLRTALQYLRHSDSDSVRVLWIDALCINQSDNAERSHQVQIMAEVYKRAQLVLVWLGPPMDDSDTAMDVLQKIALDLERPPLPHADLPAKVDDLKEPEMPRANTTKVPHPNTLEQSWKQTNKQILQLLNRPYWSRVWVIQEAAIPDTDPIIGCGYKWITWSSMARAAHAIFKFAGFGFDPSSKSQGYVSAYQNFKDINSIRYSMRNSIVNTGFRFPLLTRSWTNAFLLFDSMRGHECTDPRDHVYSLLGLIRCNNGTKAMQLGVIPDYTSTLRFVYAHTVKRIIQAEGNLQILHLKNHVSPNFLASWTPDFSISKENCYELPMFVFPVRGPAFVIQDGEPVDELKVRGKIFDDVFSAIDLDGFDTDPFGCLQMLQEAVHIILSRSRYSYRQQSENPVRPASTTSDILGYIETELIALAPLYGAHTYKHLYGEIVRSMKERKVPGIGSENSLFTEISEGILDREVGPRRRFITSNNGYYGTGTPDCGHGDVICVLDYFSTPALLRRRNDGCYAFVGSAWVHGAMDWEEYPATEADKEDIVLR